MKHRGHKKEGKKETRSICVLSNKHQGFISNEYKAVTWNQLETQFTQKWFDHHTYQEITHSVFMDPHWWHVWGTGKYLRSRHTHTVDRLIYRWKFNHILLVTAKLCLHEWQFVAELLLLFQTISERPAATGSTCRGDEAMFFFTVSQVVNRTFVVLKLMHVMTYEGASVNIPWCYKTIPV